MASEQSKAAKKPPIVALKYDEHLPGRENVAACMVWSTNSPAPQKNKQKRDRSRSRDRKTTTPGGGKSTTPGFAPESPDFQENGCNHDDENCAVEAQRGWPQRRSTQNENVDVFGLEEDNPDEFPVYYEEVENKEEKPKGKGVKKKGGKKGKGDKDDAKDPIMWELIEHKFLRDAADAREAKAAAEKAAALQKAKEARGKNSVRMNRTSQLRQIHNAPKVEKSPLSMWKMKKFENVQPHLDTKNGGEAANEDNINGDKGVTLEPSVTPLSGQGSRSLSVELAYANGEGRAGDHDDKRCMVRFEGLPNGMVTPPDGYRDFNTPGSEGSYYDTASVGIQTS